MFDLFFFGNSDFSFFLLLLVWDKQNLVFIVILLVFNQVEINTIFVFFGLYSGMGNT